MYSFEDDSDYHLVLDDGRIATMISGFLTSRDSCVGEHRQPVPLGGGAACPRSI